MDAFLKTAVVGTAQQGAHIPTTASAIDPLTQQLPTETGERSFLLAAGAQAIYAQAGMISPEAPVPLPVAEPDTLLACSMRIANLIEGLFQQPANILLPEALQLLQHLQLRLPHEVLPQFISYATSHHEAREAIAPLLGERGYWLSQFVPEWNWIAQQGQGQGDIETIWQEGTPQQRQQVLWQLRLQDPARAREWVQAVWKQEKAEVREAFLTQLHSGLSLDDQGFLEQALLDRSEGVRQQAADLILSLPSTSLTERFLAAADQFISYEPTHAQHKLAIKLPDTLNTANKEALALSPHFLEKWQPEDWLHHAFKKTPPQHWSERFSLSADAFLDLVEESQHGKDLITDIQQAALRYQAVSWYKPLLERCIRYELDASKRFDIHYCQKMLAALPQELAETLVGPLIQDKHFWQSAIMMLPTSWSQSFSQLCLQQMRLYYKKKDVNVTYYNVQTSTFAIVASAIHPACFELALQPWEIAEDDASWYTQHYKQQIATLQELIEIRKQILEEIA
ncbi:DUF5691 domain-containing protein [Dictyobacter formicarum]|uniref:Zorya protein ZorC EH domain-containing protein n=1 Tax=Dictyobacter formicarum TaxID=2778368 RepID=A0ABQ3VTI1_9CHLR|nr:DUF5691 domain-containing protein [Dictyobacter formicarum]GHO89128.1 hypothetical protein KSZ_71340 [Dictyobacter formicarum]